MDEVESATEYAVAMWTRWTHYLPTRLLERSNFHQAFRLTTNRQYSDASDPGDRTLAAFVAKGYYSFSTYDLNTKEPNLEAKLPYASHFFKTEYLFFR
jgi:hypothetical protein